MINVCYYISLFCILWNADLMSILISVVIYYHMRCSVQCCICDWKGRFLGNGKFASCRMVCVRLYLRLALHNRHVYSDARRYDYIYRCSKNGIIRNRLLPIRRLNQRFHDFRLSRSRSDGERSKTASKKLRKNSFYLSRYIKHPSNWYCVSVSWQSVQWDSAMSGHW